MQLREQVLAVLEQIGRAATAREVAMMIEGADHEAVAQTLTQLVEEGNITQLHSIVAEDVLYTF